MAKTINHHIDIYHTFDKAKKAFDRSNVPCDFLQSKGIDTSYYIDRSKTAKKSWPDKYDLIGTKQLIVKINKIDKLYSMLEYQVTFTTNIDTTVTVCTNDGVEAAIIKAASLLLSMYNKTVTRDMVTTVWLKCAI